MSEISRTISIDLKNHEILLDGETLQFDGYRGLKSIEIRIIECKQFEIETDWKKSGPKKGLSLVSS